VAVGSLVVTGTATVIASGRKIGIETRPTVIATVNAPEIVIATGRSHVAAGLRPLEAVLLKTMSAVTTP